MSAHENLLAPLAKFGSFQTRVVIVAYLTAIVAGPNVWMTVFVVYTPPHRCYIPELDDGNDTSEVDCVVVPSNLSNSSVARYIPVVDGNLQKQEWSSCTRYNESTSAGHGNVSVVSCDRGWKYKTGENVITAVSEFDLVCDKSWLAPLVPSCLMFGLMAGSFLGGILADRFGRKKVVLGALVIMCASLSISAFTPSWIGLHVLTFFIGLGDVARTSILTILLSEITPNKIRYKVTVAHILVMAVGSCMLPLMAYLLPNWRHLYGAVGLLHFLVLIPSFIVFEESPRWLLENGKLDEARNLLKKIAKMNNVKLDEAKLLELGRDRETRVNQEAEKKQRGRRKLSYLDLVRVPFLRRRIIILSIAWLAVNVSYYGVSLNVNNLGGNRYLTFFALVSVELPGHILSYFTIRKLGSRVAFMIFSSVCGVFILAVPLLQAVDDTAVVVSNVIGKLFATGTFSLLYAFTGELFPTLLRSQSYGVCSVVSRVSAVLVPFLLYLGELYHPIIPYSVMGAIVIGAAVGMFFLPETKSQPMPDTMEDAKLQNRFISKVRC
ncbi:solute carrier family 22 member 4-like isoform X1 [Clavelina lepadiformis]|uniref:solute carrier family 22 member 4-like isoform X1 n=1 Tax=Clavelina lepadiformis TaxID=159417 RepID=UPI0040427EC1